LYTPPNLNKSRTRLVALAIVLLTASCSVNESPPPTRPDADVDTGFSVVPAGSVGTCIPTEPVKGYRTCLMSAPQNRTIAGTQGQALKLPPPLPAAHELPTAVDHRADYLNGCMQVHSQGKCGWCTAHATNASLEAMLCKSSQQAHQRISEPHLWWLGKERGDFQDCKGGWYISAAFSTLGYMTDQGYLLVRGSLWPYSDDLAQMNSKRPSDAILKQQGQYGAPANTLFYMPPKEVGALKAALAAGHNVVYSVPVFKNTGWDWNNSSYGAIDAPSPAPPGLCKCSACPSETHCLSGYHAILMVGYDDGAGSFRFLNSWGSWWASGGYGTISYKLISSHGNGGRYAASLKTKTVTNKPPVAKPRYNTTKPASESDYPYDASAVPASPALVGTSIYLSSSASHDLEGDQLSPSWSVTAPDGSAVYLYYGTSSVQNLFFADKVGTYTVTLTVTEQGAAGKSASSALSIKVGDLPTPDAAWPDAAPAPDAGPPTPDLKLPPDAALPATDAPLPDTGVPDAAPAPDAPPLLNSALCASPQPLNLASNPTSVTGSTAGAANQFGLSISCGGGLTFDGSQRYFRVTLKGGVTYKITVKPSGWDASIYLFWDKACSAATINSQCASYIGDKWGGDSAESFAIKPNYEHDFVIAVDSFDPAAAGPFKLSVAW